MPALRLQSITLTAPEPREVARFYRWVLQLEPVESEDPATVVLSWGGEDRIRLVRPGEGPDGEETFTLRMPASTVADVVTWCEETEIAPRRLVVPPSDVATAREAWPDRPVETPVGEADLNSTRVFVRAPGDLGLELFFPIPKEVLVPRGQIGPFTWKSGDWTGLDVPGLLGVRTGVPDPEALRAFAGKLGVEPLNGENGPLALGDHQWVVERREVPGIYGFAVVVSLSRLGDLRRTLEHMGVDHREDDNRLLAADPGGRVVLINGVRGS